MLSGIEALMAPKGWLFVLWGILLLPLGFTIRAIPILTAMPDGFEIIGVAASILLPVGLIPIGFRYLAGRYSPQTG